MRKVGLLILLILLFSIQSFSQNWSWASSITGTNNVEFEGITLDSEDNIYAGGLRRGTVTFVNSIPLIQLTSTELANTPFFAKYDSDGNAEWALGFGDNQASNLKDIHIGLEGNIYVAGSYRGDVSEPFIIRSTNGVDSTFISRGNHDLYMAKFNPVGELLFAQNFGSSAIDRMQGITTSELGEIAVVGFWRGGTLDFENEVTLVFDGISNNGFFAILNNEGIAQNAIAFSGPWVRLESGIDRCLNEGYVTALNFQEHVNIPSHETINSTTLDHLYQQVFLKINDAGEVEWYNHIESNEVYGGNNVVCDDAGNSYFVGRFSTSITFPSYSSGNPVTLFSNGGYDGYIAKYDKEGNLKWANNWGGLSTESTYWVATNNNIITISGSSYGTVYLGSDIGARDTIISQGGLDGILINYDFDGNYLSSSHTKSSLDNEGYVGAVNSSGNSFLGGYYKSDPLKLGLLELNYTGGSDGFLAKHINIHMLPTISEVSCSNGQDGTLSVEVFGGGQEPYTYELSRVNDAVIDNGTYTGTLNFTDLESGIYRFVVTDALGRTVTKFYHLVAPDPIVIDGTVTDVTGCYGNENGEISLSVSGGVGDYTFFWDTPNGYGLVPNAQNQGSLTAGTYVVNVTDANGCINTESFEILQPDRINFEGSTVTDNTSSDPGNPNGSINLLINSGAEPYTFSWKGPNGFTSSDQSLTGIRGGTFILSLVDANGCMADTSFNLADANLFNALITQTTNPKCKGGNDGTATVNFENTTGSITIVWSNGQTDILTATNLSAGEYSVTLTDDMGTPGDTNDDVEITLMPVLIGEPDFALDVAVTVTKTTCPADNDGSIQLTVNGWSQPYEYDWSTTDGSGITNGIKDQFGLTVGSYTYTVTDKYGCAVGSSVNLSSNYSAPSFIFDVSPSNNVCEGTEVVFSTSPGFNYQFYINDVPQGDFTTNNTLIVTEPIDGMRVKAVGMNTAGCTSESEEIVLTVTPNVGIPTFTNGATTLCSGTTETYTATADNAESIVYSIQSGTAVVVPSTGEVTNIDADFTIRATAYGYNGCGEEFTELAVTVNPIPEPVISTNDNLAVCSGDDINVEFTSNIQNAQAYQWFKNGEVIAGANESSYTATAIGIYSLDVTVNDCSGLSNEYEITQIIRPEPTISTVDPLEWTEGESISVSFTVDIAAADAYQWLLNSNPITGANADNHLASEAGIYSVEVTQLGCLGTSNSLEITVVPIETYIVTFTVTNSENNAVEAAEITIPEYDPIITDASGEATISLPNGTYTFEVSTDNYQLYSGGFEVNNADLPVAVQLIGVGVNPNHLLTVNTYPNPFNNHIYITNAELVKRVIVLNITGQKVLEVNPDGANKVNAQSIKPGIYIVRLIGHDGKTAIYKMIKD